MLAAHHPGGSFKDVLELMVLPEQKYLRSEQIDCSSCSLIDKNEVQNVHHSCVRASRLARPEAIVQSASLLLFNPLLVWSFH